MPKSSRELRPSDLDWRTGVLVRDSGVERMGMLTGRRGVFRRAVARVRQVARFFYTLLTES